MAGHKICAFEAILKDKASKMHKILCANGYALTVQDPYARSIPAIRGKDGRYRPVRMILDILSLGAVGWDSLCKALVVPASAQEKEVKAPHDWYRNTGPLFSIVIIMAP